MFDMGGMYLLLGVLFLAGLLVLGVYLVHSLGLWLMAKKAGLPYAPLAWVPFAKYGVLGSLCDRSIAFRTGRRWRLAVVLPVLSLLAPSTLQLILLEYLLPDAAFLYSYTGYSLQQLFRLHAEDNPVNGLSSVSGWSSWWCIRRGSTIYTATTPRPRRSFIPSSALSFPSSPPPFCCCFCISSFPSPPGASLPPTSLPRPSPPAGEPASPQGGGMTTRRWA